MDVATLIKTMNPCLMPETYVFITIQNNDSLPRNIYERFSRREAVNAFNLYWIYETRLYFLF